MALVGTDNKIDTANKTSVSGKQNTVTQSDDVNIIGQGNTVSNSDRQNVIGNNNKAVNLSSGILIGDYQKLSASGESVIIGSLSPAEQEVGTNEQGGGSVVLGYHTVSNGGNNAVVGRKARSNGSMNTVTGYNTSISGIDGSFTPMFSSAYGSLNQIAADEEGFDGDLANSVLGSMNKIANSGNSLALGAGNRINHAFTGLDNGVYTNFGNNPLFELMMDTGHDNPYRDRYAEIISEFADSSSGSVVALGNGNTTDYAVRSQLIGTNNSLRGQAGALSSNTTMNGYRNVGSNLKNVTLMGSENKVTDASASTIIGDFHSLTGGKNNIILGSMATKERIKEKTYTQTGIDNSGNTVTGSSFTYMEKAIVADKEHTPNVNNAVKIGYNTDVQKDNGVALGSMSVASTDAGIYGLDPLGGKILTSDADIAKLSGKESEISQLNAALPNQKNIYEEAKTAYEASVTDYLQKKFCLYSGFNEIQFF